MGLGWLGGALGAVGNVLGGIFGANEAEQRQADQFKNQLELMKQQHEYQVEDYKNRYQWAAEDMQKAGLNRILAATQGIGGSISGVSAGNAAMASVPDFGHAGDTLAQGLTAAAQMKTNKDIAKMANNVAKDELELKRIDINSALKKRENDIALDNARFDLEKMVQEAAVKRADALNSAQIENMKERLQADIEHYERMDLNGAAMAAAAMQSANAAGLQAAVAAELGVSKQEVMEAEQAYIGLQSQNIEESTKWQRWLNAHPHTRGAVGFIGAFFDTMGLVKRSVGAAYSGIKSTGIGDDW